MGPPKSRYGRREVPLDHVLVLALRDCHKATEWPGAEDPVFPASNGAYLDADAGGWELTGGTRFFFKQWGGATSKSGGRERR